MEWMAIGRPTGPERTASGEAGTPGNSGNPRGIVVRMVLLGGESAA